MVSELALEHVTRDALWGGDLVFWQPARGAGYRFNLDPVLLAGFVSPAKHILDLGAGCGIIGLLLVAEGKAQRVTCVEVQQTLAELATKNALENRFDEQIRVLHGDLRTMNLPAADAVVFNPPYFRVGEGRTSPEPGRDIARRERNGTLNDFVEGGFRCLHEGASVYCIVRLDREHELKRIAQRVGGSVTRTRPVAARRDTPPRHSLVELRKRPGLPSVEEPALVVHENVGYTDEVRALLHA